MVGVSFLQLQDGRFSHGAFDVRRLMRLNTMACRAVSRAETAADLRVISQLQPALPPYHEAVVSLSNFN